MNIVPPSRFAVRVTLGYTALSLAWIFLSDRLLSSFTNIDAVLWLSVAKGVGFVLVTATLLLIVLDGQARGLAKERSEVGSASEAKASLPRWVGYIFALVLTLATLLLRARVSSLFEPMPFLILLIFPIILSAMVGGLGPGLVATVLAALGMDLVVLPPTGSLVIADTHELFGWVLLIGNGVLVSFMSDTLHRARNAAEDGQLQQAVAQRQSAASEARLGLALAASGMGVWEWDVRTNATFVSPQCGTILGADPDKVTLAALTDLVDRTNAERVVGLARQAMADRTAFSAELRVVLPDGSAQRLAVTGRAQYGADGQPLKLVGTLQDVTDRAAREHALARVSRAYATLSRINKTILRVSTREELFDEVCEIASAIAGYRLAWVGWLDKATHEVVPLARAGEAQDYVDRIRVFADDGPEGQGPTGVSIREDRTVVCKDFLHDPPAAPWQAAASASGLRATAVMPIHFQGEVHGALAVYAGEANLFGDEEITLLNEAAASISFAIDRLEGEAKRERAEADLRQREALLARTSRMAKVGGWGFDAKTRRGYWTEEVARIFDLDPEPVPSVERRLEFFQGASRAAIEQALREAVEQGKPYDIELDLVTAEGARKWVRTHGDPVVRDGQVVWIEGVVQDITERKQAELSLAAERTHLRSLLNTIPDLIWLKDPEGVYLNCNRAFEGFFGHAEDAIVGRTDYEFVDAELADFFRLHDQKAMAAGGPTITEEWVTYADDGRGALFQTIKTPMRDASGRLIGVLGIGRDITSIRETQNALKASEERYRLMVEGLKTEYIFYRHDKEGVLSYVSPSVTDVLGYAPAEVHRHFSAFLTNTPGNAEVAGKVAAAIGGASVPAFEAEVLHKDGSTRQIEVLEVPMLGAEGDVVDIFGIMHDITERRRAEERLKESQNMLFSITEAAQDAIAVMDEEGRTLLWNAAAERLFGYSAEEMVGRDLHQTLMLEHLHAAFQRGFASFKETGQGAAVGRVVELPAVTRDGRKLDVEVSLSSVQIGGRWHAVGIVRDITKRKQTEQNLRQLSVAVEQSPVSIVITDLDARIQYANPAFSEISGYSLEEALGQNPGILQSGKTPRETFADLWATITAGGVWRGELTNRRKDGREYVELATISPVREPDGRISHYLAVKEDISERKHGEAELERHRHHLEELVAERTAALQAAEEHARLILSSTADGLFGVDGEGRATFVNPAACRMLGYSGEQMLGRSLHTLIHHHRKNGSPHLEEDCPLRRSAREGMAVAVAEDVLWRADGGALPVQYAAHPMRRDGEIVGAVVSFFDITAQREAQAAREQALAEAERLARVRSEFLANMSHEIRTPLNAVLGLAQVGQRDRGEGRAQDHFRRILDAGQLLLAIVNDVLDFSKIEAGKLELEHIPCHLGDVIDRAVELLAQRAAAKGLALLVEEAPDLPGTFDGDPVRLIQVLVNLLSNAVKFTEAGGVILSAGREAEVLVLRVTDTGAGVSAEQQARLFNPFEQADGATTRRFGGTGLGLAISRRLVDLMGGGIRVTSVLGEGSTFEVRLPMAQPTPAPAPAPAPTFRTVALAGLRVAEACSLTQALQARGMTVSTCTPDTAFYADADLVVLANEALDQPAVGESARAVLASGRQLAILCDSGESSSIPPKVREGGRIIERPLRVRHLMAAAAARDTAAQATPVGPRLAEYRLLAAEDNEVNRLVLEEMMTGEGAQVLFAENGRLAVERVREGEQRFDLMLMDVQMPEMDGLEATRQVLQADPVLPVIGLTAHAMPQERERCLAAGMVDHVAKPFDLDELVAAILRHARRIPGMTRSTGQPLGPMRVSQPADGPIIEWAGLEARFGGPPGFVDKLAATMLKSHAAAPEELRSAAARNDFEALAFLTHGIKGMAGNMLAAEAQGIAKEAEAAARAGQAKAPLLAERLAGAVEVMLAEAATRLQANESLANTGSG